MYSKKVSFEKFEVEILMKQTCRSCCALYIYTTCVGEAKTLVVLRMVLRDQHTPCTQNREYFKFIESDVSMLVVELCPSCKIFERRHRAENMGCWWVILKATTLSLLFALLDLCSEHMLRLDMRETKKRKKSPLGICILMGAAAVTMRQVFYYCWFSVLRIYNAQTREE